MTVPTLCRALALAFLVSFAGVRPVPAAAPPPLPALVVEAPPKLAAVADQVRGFSPDLLRAGMRLTGLETPGPPITVVLAEEGSQAERSAPAWVSGWAFGDRGLVVLLPSRVLRYPDDSLQSLLQHEVTHVLISRAARGQAVPRWFDEGLAMTASRDRDLEDRTRVLLAVLVDGPGSLARIDEAFAGNQRSVQAAYAFAQDFVQDVIGQHGTMVMAQILRRLAEGDRFDDAFQAATGQTLSEAEASYWSRRTFWNRWVPVLSSSTLLWIGISFLALAAIRRRRVRDAETRRRWEAEEAWEATEDEEKQDEELVN